jgi:hypothetical protein
MTYQVCGYHTAFLPNSSPYPAVSGMGTGQSRSFTGQSTLALMYETSFLMYELNKYMDMC